MYQVLCTWVCIGLDGSTCSESLPELTCHVEPPEHVPRTSARAQTCVRGLGGLLACHGAESKRKDPWPEEKRLPKGQNSALIYVYILGLSWLGLIIYFLDSGRRNVILRTLL